MNAGMQNAGIMFFVIPASTLNAKMEISTF